MASTEKSNRRCFTVALLLVLAMSTSGVLAQFVNSLELLSGESGGGSGHYSVWDAADASVDLTGLWGSIDTQRDHDPVWTVRPSDGTTFLVWSKDEGVSLEIVWAAKPLGGMWGGVDKIEAIPTSTDDDMTPSVNTDSYGDLHVVWTRMTPTGGRILHALHVNDLWTAPLMVSGAEAAHTPELSSAAGQIFVQYHTATSLVTVEIVVTHLSGGSDDIDPEGSVTVEANEIRSEIVLK